MARPRQPSAVAAVKGTYATNPEKVNKREPKVDLPFPNKAPAHMSPGGTACWYEIVMVVPRGVLTGADVFIVEVVADLLNDIRSIRAAGGMPSATHVQRLTSELAKLGLTPSARASLTVADRDDNPFAEF